jgi:polar amino acid transport system substrate-binding protein
VLRSVCHQVKLRAAALTLLLPLAAAAKPLQLCHDAAVDPKYEISATVGAYTVTGLHNVMTLQVLSKLGIEVQLQSMPWLRCLHAVTKGDIDGAIGVGWNAERSRSMHFPLQPNGEPDPAQALFSVNYYVYSHAQGDLQWDGQKFHQIKFGIAAPKGFIVAQILQQLGVYNPLEVEIDAAIMLTVNRRIDGFVQSGTVAEGQLAHSKDASLIKKLEPVFFRQPLYLVFSKLAMQRNPTQLKQIWQTIPEFRSAPADPSNSATQAIPETSVTQ